MDRIVCTAVSTLIHYIEHPECESRGVKFNSFSLSFVRFR